MTSVLVDARVVSMSIIDRTIMRALQYVASEAGWTVNSPAPILATDRVDALPEHDGKVVLVINPVPALCRTAVAAVTAGSAHAVVSTSNIDAFGHALDAAAAGICCIPDDVIAKADGAPKLTERELEVLGAVMAGQSNAAIARATYLSQATIKRVITELLRTFGTENRSALTAAAAAVGHRPQRVRP